MWENRKVEGWGCMREAVIRAPVPGGKTHRQKYEDNPRGFNGFEMLRKIK